MSSRIHRRTGFGVGLIVLLGFFAMLLGDSAGVSAADPADLSLTKSDSPDPVSTGGALTYTIGVSNNGPDAATNVVVVDNLPKGVNFVSATSSQGTCSASSNKRKITCKLGTIVVVESTSPTGPVYTPESAMITIQVVAPQKAGTITNSASVSGDVTDPKPGNNSATATTRVVAPKAPPKTKAATCHGRKVTLLGTSGVDLLIGTQRSDVVSALGGADRISTDGGKDLVCAGRGNDVVKTGGKPDRVFAGPGADRLFGRGGSDALRGSLGNDLIRGGRGPDLLVGGRGRDRCFGGPGADALRNCDIGR